MDVQRPLVASGLPGWDVSPPGFPPVTSKGARPFLPLPWNRPGQ